MDLMKRRLSPQIIDAVHHVALFEYSGQQSIERALRLAALSLRAPAALLRIGAEGGHISQKYIAPDAAITSDTLSSFGTELDRRYRSAPFAESPFAFCADSDESNSGSGMMVAVPLASPGGDLIGTLAVVDREPRSCGPREIAVLANIADGLFECLKLQQENTHRRQKEAHLASQKHVLRLIVAGAPMRTIMRALAVHVEQQTAGALCVISLIRSNGKVRQIASPTMPESFLALLNEHVVQRPQSAQDTAEPVIVFDLTAPGRDAFEREAVAHGFQSYWCAPIRSDGKLVGSIELYRVTAGEPANADRQVMAVSTALARIAIQRRRAEKMLRRREEYYRTVARATNDVIWDWHIATDQVRWTGALADLIGDVGETVVNSGEWTRGNVHPDDRAAVLASLQQVLAEPGVTWSHEYRFRRSDGTYAAVLDRAFVIRNERGEPVRMVGAMLDLTKRRDLEDQLRQAQRMEAVGRLAGGVAHDFNNLLTVISGFANLLREEEMPAEAQSCLTEIERAADRATGLTRQLLAFSRRQVLQPSVIDLNQVVRSVERMLRRLITENIHLSTRLGTEAGLVYIDPGQLEQVIVNLVVNAKDAMPGGGNLTIETSVVNVPPDNSSRESVRYTSLAISDSGHGMDEATVARVFEPFFTTKPPGTGTGLGLSTVYGIVQQSGGRVSIESKLGQGTRVEILLPQAAQAATAKAAEADPEESLSGTESILVVEDDPAIRNLTPKLLTPAGYNVQVASDGMAALRQLELTGFKPDLLLTDVVLPGMSGRSVAEEIKARVPELSVVYMSGYTDEELGRHGVLDAGVAFVNKPFSRSDLLRVVRRKLDDRHTQNGGAKQPRLSPP
jgi:PAS domain S-box-containing protein